jgi:hypothetical protein
MEDPKLRQQLEKLQEEIRQTRSVDDKGKALLQNLEADIQALLARSRDESLDVPPSTLTGLQASLVHFEVTHPSLTALISDLLDNLSNVGI